MREWDMALAQAPSQTIVTLDLEGVLVPEIWIAVAEATGIPALRRTTRDEPNYDLLMSGRLDILDQHGLTMSKLQEVIATLQPLAGAVEFLNELCHLTQVMILSDTFEQFGGPLTLNYRVIAAGDSYNDTAMLEAAEHGFLFHAPDNVIREFPHLPALTTYDDLLAHIKHALG